MNSLKCTTCNCEHNQACHCEAGIISIDQKGTCTTKQKRSMGILEQNKVNMQQGSEFDLKNCPDLFIQCDSTKCKYNENHTCTSEIVNISDGLMRTKCYTKTVN